MKRRVTSLEWKENLDKITPAKYRIGKDLLYIEDYNIPDMAYEPWKTDVTTAIIYIQGSADISINMKRYEVKAPAMVIMLSEQIMQLHNYSCDLKTTCLVMSTRFTNDLFANANKTTSIYNSVYQNPILQLDETGSHVLSFYLKMMKDLIQFQSNPYRLDAAKHLTLTLFFGYVHRIHALENEKNGYANNIVNEFITLLKKNYKEKRETSFYAKKLCITPKYLTTLLKDITGKTAHEWIDEYVSVESKALLRSTKMTIEQISDSLSFSSQDNFSKFFKRVVGMSPTEYRKRY